MWIYYNFMSNVCFEYACVCVDLLVEVEVNKLAAIILCFIKSSTLLLRKNNLQY